ncbi:amidohydrolase family protein [uncultured Gimesia sp.]|jgi:L-fuconolactonase|uniref:amidohydrolase family protein n=1 Tax=uncultured Gimesia sp. TaxID=1678688 RepID=UPI00260D3859|nr:amidohydrolase family protein [uncultured Gimesia sp.]
MTQIPVIDTHQHLWDLDLFDLPWLESPGVDPLRRSFVMSDYLEATQNCQVEQTVYMEVNVHPDLQQQEARYVLELCSQVDNPMSGAVIGGRPGEARFGRYLEEFAGNPFVKGVRTVLHDPDRPPGMCLQPQFKQNIKLLGELGLSFDLCMRPGEIQDAVELVDACPDTRFIIDHCGNLSVQPDQQADRPAWETGMQQMAERPQVMCKISGIIATATKGGWRPEDLKQNINFCLDTFGEDRVFFGGDWPVCTLKSSFESWLNSLKWIVQDRPETFQRKLFHDNAETFYCLG